MLELIIRVVRFVVVTVLIGLIVRLWMNILGIDKQLDGKNKTWDKYRKQEAKLLNVTGKCLRKTGEKIKDLTKEVKEEINTSLMVVDKEKKEKVNLRKECETCCADEIMCGSCTEEKSNYKKEEVNG